MRKPPQGTSTSAIWQRGYIAGIKAAAAFAGEWNAQIDCKNHFEDVILGKFNLIGNKLRRNPSFRKRKEPPHAQH